jgi:hypothetical protein
MKWDTSIKNIAGDIVTFVDDLRAWWSSHGQSQGKWSPGCNI